MKVFFMSAVMHACLLAVMAVLALFSSTAEARSIERDRNEDPNSTEPHCMIVSKTSSYHQYRGTRSVEFPKAADLGKGKLLDGGEWLRINRYFCERFFSKDPNDRFVTRRGSLNWYDKNEFYHESELIPVDHWRTRYVYSKSSTSYLGSELVARSAELSLDRLLGFGAYMIGSRYENLLQFSDDGYYYDRAENIRWRLVYVPNLKFGIDIHSVDEPIILMIDETGRYLPSSVPIVNSQQYTYHCERQGNAEVSCGYGLKTIPSNTGAPDQRGLRFNGAIRNISAGFTPMKIESDKVTITRRLSHGEKFWLDDRHEVDVNNFFFYADFDDPIRPVYFAPGVLLRDRPKGYERAPRNEDFINREVCLTDCPSDTEWQLSGIRKRIEAHP